MSTDLDIFVCGVCSDPSVVTVDITFYLTILIRVQCLKP